MIIGFTGIAGCGKTTAAQYLAHEHNWTHLKMADPLKNMLRSLFKDMGYDRSTIEAMVEGQLKDTCRVASTKVTPRRMMQTLGTEWGRQHMGENFWAQAAAQRVLTTKGHIVFDDVRFDNEAAIIRKLGGTIIAIHRRGHKNVAESHSSEQGVSRQLVDMTWWIDGGVDQLTDAIQRIIPAQA